MNEWINYSKHFDVVKQYCLSCMSQQRCSELKRLAQYHGSILASELAFRSSIASAVLSPLFNGSQTKMFTRIISEVKGVPDHMWWRERWWNEVHTPYLKGTLLLGLAQWQRRHGFDPRVRKVSWRRKWQPTAVFLPGESHGQRSLVGVPGVTKSWTQLSVWTHTLLWCSQLLP